MGIFDWLKKKEVVPAVANPGPEEWRRAAHWGARSRWISHASETLGDPTDEFAPTPGNEIPNRPDFLVLEFSPREGRPHYTYLTAGLALWPQAPSGPTPHIEIIAYSDRPEPRIAQFLFTLSHDIASGTAAEVAFKPLDLWRAELFGLRDFMLAPARDHEELLDFPNVAKRKEDQRYLLGATGELDGQMELTVVQLVPLTVTEWETASAKGSPALLEQLKWEEQPKAYGWSAMRAG